VEVAAMAAVTVDGLTKRYGDVLALDSVAFDVREAEVFGFLGPNGLGKATTINIVAGMAGANAKRKAAVNDTPDSGCKHRGQGNAANHSRSWYVAFGNC